MPDTNYTVRFDCLAQRGCGVYVASRSYETRAAHWCYWFAEEGSGPWTSGRVLREYIVTVWTLKSMYSNAPPDAEMKRRGIVGYTQGDELKVALY